MNAQSAWDRIVNVGMVRKETGVGQSTAIFEARKARPRSTQTDPVVTPVESPAGLFTRRSQTGAP